MEQLLSLTSESSLTLNYCEMDILETESRYNKRKNSGAYCIRVIYFWDNRKYTDKNRLKKVGVQSGINGK